MKVVVRMTEDQYEALLSTTQTGSAVALCGQCSRPDDLCFMVHREAQADDKQNINDCIAIAKTKGMAILITSRMDTPCHDALCSKAREAGLPVLRAVIDERGTLSGLLINVTGEEFQINTFSVVGDTLNYHTNGHTSGDLPKFVERHAQCLGEATAYLLRQLTVGVVGVSGTGSIVVEQLARLGVGRMVLIEPDTIETRNLNRVLNSGTQDVGSLKTFVAARSIQHMRLGTVVTTLPTNLASNEAIQAISVCDVVFGCMDSAEGRHILNRVATFYTIPYFDVGLHLKADGKGGIGTIHGSVHVIRPGASSMLSRGAITQDRIRFDARQRQFPDEPLDALEGDYIKGAKVDSPAVISFNMFYASLAVIEFLNRLHRFRDKGGSLQDWICVSLSEDSVLQIPMQWHEEPCMGLSRYLGRGDMVPLLDRPELSPVEVV